MVLDNDTNCNNFPEDKFVHGGYKCGSDGKWSSQCQKYYCDLGYYYNIYRGKCMRDYCTNEPKEINITLNDTYEKTLILNFENNDEYIFIIDSHNFAYSFEANLTGFIYYDSNTTCPSSFEVKMDEPNHKNKIYVNYYKNITDQEIKITIKSKEISNNETKNEGLESWVIALILIGSLIVIGVVILLIFKLKSGKTDMDDIGSLTEKKEDELVELHQKN